VTNPQLVVREMSVSNLPAKEMHQSLPFQVRDMLPLAVERSLLDFHPLEEPGDSPTVRGLLIAMPKDAVLEAVTAVENAGLHVEGSTSPRSRCCGPPPGWTPRSRRSSTSAPR